MEKRNVAIVGIGQTKHAGRRPDVNQVELIKEAVDAALRDAGLTMADVEFVVHGNMEHFEGIFQPDMWHVDGDGAYMKPGVRVATGGTTGGTVACAAHNIVASGLYDVVLAVAFEKQDECAQTTAAITGVYDPLWGRAFATGAISGLRALRYVNEFGERAERVAAKIRVKAANNALRNPYAHLRIKITEEDVMNSRLLVYPMRLLHMCPESCGACALILAAEKRALEITDKPVWYVDHVTVHMAAELSFGQTPSMEVAARKLYERNGITNPLEEIDVFEMYEPNVWTELEWMGLFFFLPPEECLRMVEEGETEIQGKLPINPSGGVVSTNPIGATGLIRVAEAALQVRGDAGEHQVPKEVRTAMASAFGGSNWTILHLLKKSL